MRNGPRFRISFFFSHFINRSKERNLISPRLYLEYGERFNSKLNERHSQAFIGEFFPIILKWNNIYPILIGVRWKS